MTLRPTVREVLLDVVVTDSKGKPVKGLKQSDFTLLEDGAPQRFNHFEEHQAMTAAELAKAKPGLKMPPNTFTNFISAPNTNASTVILLDALDTPVSAQMYLRGQVIDYMKTVPPGTSIAIFSLDTEMHLIQGFSSDPQVLLDAVKSKRDEPKLSLLLGTRNEVSRQFRQDILVSGMQMLGRYLAGFPGRKNLIWFTGVVPRTMYEYGIGNPFQDSSSFIDDIAQTTDELVLSRVAVYPVDARGLETDPAFSAANSGAGRSGGVGRSPTGFGTRQFFDHAALDDVAEATGGKAYYNTNGLKNSLAEIVDAGSNYYTIAYSPTNKNWDGGRRSIKLQVDQEGLSLQYRHAYRARNRQAVEDRHGAAVERRLVSKGGAPFVPATGNQQVDVGGGVMLRRAPKESMQAAMALGAIPPTEIIFSLSLTPGSTVSKLGKNDPLPKDSYLTAKYHDKPTHEYQVLFRMSPASVQWTQSPDGIRHGRVEFVTLAYDDQGELVNSMISAVEMDLSDATYRKTAQNGLGIRQAIAIPVKGNYFVRAGVHDVTADRVGALEIPVDEVKPGVAGLGQTLTP